MASSEEYQDYSEFGWECEETDEEIVQINGQLYKKSEAPEPSEEEIKQARILELEAYLSSTDWCAIRESETGIDIPADVKQARADARAEISSLRGE